MKEHIYICDICGKKDESLHELSIAVNGAYKLKHDFCDEHFHDVLDMTDKFIRDLLRMKR